MFMCVRVCVCACVTTAALTAVLACVCQVTDPRSLNVRITLSYALRESLYKPLPTRMYSSKDLSGFWVRSFFVCLQLCARPSMCVYYDSCACVSRGSFVRVCMWTTMCIGSRRFQRQRVTQ